MPHNGKMPHNAIHYLALLAAEVPVNPVKKLGVNALDISVTSNYPCRAITMGGF
jgi:hypothetical protein|tara:strand:+ start:296 stop:457 length:162 start_codon:yes stop_codon:yes gene_type:complete